MGPAELLRSRPGAQGYLVSWMIAAWLIFLKKKNLIGDLQASLPSVF